MDPRIDTVNVSQNSVKDIAARLVIFMESYNTTTKDLIKSIGEKQDNTMNVMCKLTEQLLLTHDAEELMDSFKMMHFMENFTIVPSYPQCISKQKVVELITFFAKELHLLASTVDLSKSIINGIWLNENTNLQSGKFGVEEVVQQSQSLANMWHKSLEIGTAAGINLSAIIELIHEANLNKRFDNGQFIFSHNELLTPTDWKAPDILGEIKRQYQRGSWSL